MLIDFGVIDAGARYGLHPSWESLINLANFYLFEPDNQEATRLAQKYSSRKNIVVNPKALFSENKTLEFRVSRHRALNSIFPANVELLKKEGYKLSEFDSIGVINAQATTIDDYCKDKSVHFLKLDTEGSELDILRGAEITLASTILGVRIEALFVEIYKGCPLFGDIHKFMLSRGFELLNLDYDGKGASFSPYAAPGRFGKLMSTDGVWIRPFSDIFNPARASRDLDIIRLATFLMNNNAEDAAVKLLIDAVDVELITFAPYEHDPLFAWLRFRIASHFKNLAYLPSIDLERMYETYKKIFSREFPRLNEFYEYDWT